MRCHIKVKNKTLKHCSIKTPSLVKFNFNIHVYEWWREVTYYSDKISLNAPQRPTCVCHQWKNKNSENYPYRTLSSNSVFWHWHIVYLTVLLTDLRKNYITMHIIRSLAGMSFKKKGTIIWTLQWFNFRSFKVHFISDPFDINTWIANLI